MASVILAVVAHPDDESFWCGATLAQHALNGDAVHVLALSDGTSSRFTRWSLRRWLAQLVRDNQFQSACAALGAKGRIVHAFPDQQSDTVPQLTINRIVEKVVKELRPSVVYTHYRYDLNLDHRRVWEAAQVAFRPHVVREMAPEYPDLAIKRALPGIDGIETSVDARTRKAVACGFYRDEAGRRLPAIERPEWIL